MTIRSAWAVRAASAIMAAGYLQDFDGLVEALTDAREDFNRASAVAVIGDALRSELPLTARRAVAVSRDREEIAAILTGADDRLIVVVGPCSINDPVAAIDYARRLAPLPADARTARLCPAQRHAIRVDASGARARPRALSSST